MPFSVAALQSVPAPALSNLQVAIRELRAAEYKSGWQRVHALGEILITYRAVENSASSFRELATHPDCPLSKTQLRDILSAETVFRETPAVRSSTHLSPSHLALVTSFSSTERASLLGEAEQKKLTVRELCVLIRAQRPDANEGRGRPSTSGSEKAVTRIDNAATQLDEALSLLTEGSIRPDTRSKLNKTLSEVKTLVRKTEAKLKAM